MRRRLTPAHPVTFRTPTAEPSPPSTEAAFTCDADGISPEELSVAPDRTGVTITVDNRTGSLESFVGGNGGTNAPPGLHTMKYPGGGGAWPLAPGDYDVKCVPVSVSEPDSVPAAMLHVVDENGVWASTNLDCRTGERFSAAASYPVGAGFATLDAAVHDAMDGYASPGDVIVGVGYPDAALPQFALVRDTRQIILASFFSTEQDKWLPDDLEGCTGESRTKGGFHAPIAQR